MYAEERKFAIAQTARENGRVTVAELAGRFDVTAETIRQDLNALQRSRILRRVHGGAIPYGQAPIESQIADRIEFAEEKRAIAQAALALLPGEGAIFIESGSTAMFLAELLPRDRPLTVFTNSLAIATHLVQRPELTVMTLGGHVRSVTLGEVGSLAIRSLGDITVDVAFLGTNGISAVHGLTTPDQAEAEFKRATLQMARQRVLLTDRSKIGARTLWRYGSASDVDTVITDRAADVAELDGLRAAVDSLVVV